MNSEEIDEVAAKIRKISPKFDDLIRPDVINTQKWLKYEQEVESQIHQLHQTDQLTDQLI